MNQHHHYVDTLGRILGETIAEAEGQELLDKIETIRTLAKSTQSLPIAERSNLIGQVQSLNADEMEKIARAFSLFLNLSNIVEQYFSNDKLSNQLEATLSNVEQQIKQLQSQGIAGEQIINALLQLKMELVLTAHPTEITRRTLIDKQNKIYQLLPELEQNLASIRQIIAQWWHTNEIRSNKPTPVDEAKWGFAVIEHSLWDAVPEYIEQLEQITQQQFNLKLPLSFNPISFVSWMGGDRDGNPFVTTSVTKEVMLLSRWKAADLFLKDINLLISELSMNRCNAELKQWTEQANEPYRMVLKQVRQLLINTQQYCECTINGQSTDTKLAILTRPEQLSKPLLACYQSLIDCSMGVIADGNLKKCLRHISCFGINLLPLDIRQDSQRHTLVLSELTQYLELGDYGDWNESQRIEFLTSELNNKRPLFPTELQLFSDDVQETINCFKLIAQSDPQSVASYIISMAKQPSDVLIVQLLLKQFGCHHYLPIVPLFETLNDLNNAEQCMQSLFEIGSYHRYIQGDGSDLDSIDQSITGKPKKDKPITNKSRTDKNSARQMVMIGYSDSAKDAGVIAASWAQYSTQEALLRLCQQHQVKLTLFHGRGGTIGRGGAPAHAALMSQPPGSLDNGLRVTEQGEMIRNKFGLSITAVNSFNLYTNAILQSQLIPPPVVKSEWRDVMKQLSSISAKAYRDRVTDKNQFIKYFNSATPIKELSKLPLGSRPAKRHKEGGIETLRAIPWIFSWSQNRLLLPAWYGAGQALEQTYQAFKSSLREMCIEWPFFTTRMSMLQMVYAKTNAELSSFYDSVLVAESQQIIGVQLRDQLQKDIEAVLNITEDKHLMQNIPWIEQAVNMRNTYIDPLNLLQVELLKRYRQPASSNSSQDKKLIESALMISITGIAAGLRNTG